MNIRKISTPVTLEPDWHDYFKRKSELTGVPMAALYRTAFEAYYGEDKKKLEGQLAYQQALKPSAS